MGREFNFFITQRQPYEISTLSSPSEPCETLIDFRSGFEGTLIIRIVLVHASPSF
jgi:hypothetical protein